MFTPEERTARIATIAGCPALLRKAVEGLNDEQLDTPYRDGGWTVRQVVHHLVDSHANAMLRFRWTVSEDNTTIKTYDQDVWATHPDYRMPIEPSLGILDGLHQRLSFFLSALPESAWSRKAFHPEHGDMSLDDLLKMYSDHGADHTKQITDLRARKGW